MTDTVGTGSFELPAAMVLPCSSPGARRDPMRRTSSGESGQGDMPRVSGRSRVQGPRDGRARARGHLGCPRTSERAATPMTVAATREGSATTRETTRPTGGVAVHSSALVAVSPNPIAGQEPSGDQRGNEHDEQCCDRPRSHGVAKDHQDDDARKEQQDDVVAVGRRPHLER